MTKDLLNLVKKAGVVGAGGAGFPTHIKLNTKAGCVIVNGAECEPLLRVDQQLMSVESKKLLDGLKLIMDSVGAEKGIIALKEKYKIAKKNLEENLTFYSNIELHKLKNFYPAGDEQIIVYETTGRVVPEGGIPLNVGVIVINVETIINIYEAYYNEKPVTETYLTVSGAVNNKKTIPLPIGMKVEDVIDIAGGTYLDDYVIINGGPMMGKIVDKDSTITKTTKGLIVLPRDHSLVKSLSKGISEMLKDSKISCMHCSHCSEVCPRNLIGHRIAPDKLMRLASYRSVCSREITPMNAYLCCECRLCEYACIMNLQPWKLNSSLKLTMASNKIVNNLKNKPEKVHPFREYKRYPVTKLVHKLELNDYDVDAPLSMEKVSVNRVEILLKQSIGVPSKPLVKVGETVKVGQLIAEIDGDKLGSNIHSSIDGVIIEIKDTKIVIVGGK